MLPPGYTAVHNSRLPWTVLFNLFCFVLCVCFVPCIFVYFFVVGFFCCCFFVVFFSCIFIVFFYCILHVCLRVKHCVNYYFRLAHVLNVERFCMRIRFIIPIELHRFE